MVGGGSVAIILRGASIGRRWGGLDPPARRLNPAWVCQGRAPRLPGGARGGAGQGARGLGDAPGGFRSRDREVAGGQQKTR